MKHFPFSGIIKMDHFKQLELKQFVHYRGLRNTPSHYYENIIRETDEEIAKLTPSGVDYYKMIEYLRNFYACCESPGDTDYLDERISRYERLIPYEIEPSPPKSVLRRRKIEKLPC